MREDCYALGMEAARSGLTLLDCPYFRAPALPSCTGEDVGCWKQRVDAWELGWRDAMEQRAILVSFEVVDRVRRSTH